MIITYMYVYAISSSNKLIVILYLCHGNDDEFCHIAILFSNIWISI